MRTDFLPTLLAESVAWPAVQARASACSRTLPRSAAACCGLSATLHVNAPALYTQRPRSLRRASISRVMCCPLVLSPPASQGFNFWLVPVRHQLLVVNIVSLADCTFLSFVKHQARGKARRRDMCTKVQAFV